MSQKLGRIYISMLNILSFDSVTPRKRFQVNKARRGPQGTKGNVVIVIGRGIRWERGSRVIP